MQKRVLSFLSAKTNESVTWPKAHDRYARVPFNHFMIKVIALAVYYFSFKILSNSCSYFFDNQCVDVFQWNL